MVQDVWMSMGSVSVWDELIKVIITYVMNMDMA